MLSCSAAVDMMFVAPQGPTKTRLLTHRSDAKRQRSDELQHYLGLDSKGGGQLQDVLVQPEAPLEAPPPAAVEPMTAGPPPQPAAGSTAEAAGSQPAGDAEMAEVREPAALSQPAAGSTAEAPGPEPAGNAELADAQDHAALSQPAEVARPKAETGEAATPPARMLRGRT